MTPHVFERLKEAVHFVCFEARDMTLGSIRLSKIIFCSDRATYISTLKPMITDSYVRGPQGPYLKELRKAVAALDEARVISVKKTRVGKVPFTKYLLLKNPRRNFLSKEECELLRELTHVICTDYSAEDISEATHNAAWKMASDDEYIPLAAQLVVSPGRVSRKHMEWAVEDELEPSNA